MGAHLDGGGYHFAEPTDELASGKAVATTTNPKPAYLDLEKHEIDVLDWQQAQEVRERMRELEERNFVAVEEMKNGTEARDTQERLVKLFAFLEQLSLPDSKKKERWHPRLHALKLALEEALTNTVKKRGPTGGQLYEEGPDGEKQLLYQKGNVRFGIDIDNGRPVLVILMSDDGDGFNPYTVLDPTVGDNLERPNGRGILLIAEYIVTHEKGLHGEFKFLPKEKTMEPSNCATFRTNELFLRIPLEHLDVEHLTHTIRVRYQELLKEKKEEEGPETVGVETRS